MTFNRHDAATAMLTEIEEWCARTATHETSIGHVLFLHPGFVGLLRKRLTLSEEKEIAVRQFIYCDHPDGYRGELPITHANGTRPVKRPAHTSKLYGERNGHPEYPTARLSEAEIAARRVERDPCPFCGTRADVGCRHIAYRVVWIGDPARPPAEATP